jgi:hypothetical protein
MRQATLAAAFALEQAEIASRHVEVVTVPNVY